MSEIFYFNMASSKKYHECLYRHAKEKFIVDDGVRTPFVTYSQMGAILTDYNARYVFGRDSIPLYIEFDTAEDLLYFKLKFN